MGVPKKNASPDTQTWYVPEGGVSPVFQETV